MRKALVGAALAAMTVAAVPAGPATAAGAPVVVVTGLDNPRQLNWSTSGALVIAEAGRGGRNCLGEGEDRMCLGPTGAVSVVTAPATTVRSAPQRRVTGLMSAANPAGVFAVGSDGADLRGNHYFTAITSVPPDLPPFPSTTQSGYLLRSAMGRTARFADISGYERRVNPDGAQVESNPYAVLALDGTDRVLVADAAANAVLSVDGAGRVSTLKTWPPVKGKPEFVPTSLAQDAQGFVYVGGLGSETPGAAQVVKMTSSGRTVKTFTGFSGITGVAVDAQGFLYVAELFAGKVTKVGGSKRWTLDVPFPSGLAVDRAQNVYVAAFSIADRDGAPAVDAPGTEDDAPALPGGEVWKIRF